MTHYFGDTLESSFLKACRWLDTCGKNGITLRPSPTMLRAMSEFPTPKNHSDVFLVWPWKSCAYVFCMTDKKLPFLLKPTTTFYWGDNLQRLFNESKMKILDGIEYGVRIFDKTKPACLATDCSKSGIGFRLFQKQCKAAQEQIHFVAMVVAGRSCWSVVVSPTQRNHATP